MAVCNYRNYRVTNGKCIHYFYILSDWLALFFCSSFIALVGCLLFILSTCQPQQSLLLTCSLVDHKVF